MDLLAFLRGLSVLHFVMVSVAAVSLAAFISDRTKRALLLNPYRVRRGEYYRLLTSGWIHADGMHLAANMFVLYLFADRVLRTFGALMFVALYVTAVLVANLPTTVRYRDRPKYNSLGASGAVAAVMLSSILLDPTVKMRVMFLPMPAIVFGVLYILYSVWHSRGSDDNINHDAHFSGALYGVLVTSIWAPSKVGQSVRVVGRMLGI